MENQEENSQDGNGNQGSMSEEQAGNINQQDSGDQDGNGSHQSVDHNSSDEHMQIDEEGVEIDPDDQA